MAVPGSALGRTKLYFAMSAAVAAVGCAPPSSVPRPPTGPKVSAAEKPASEKKPYAVLVTSTGTITVRLFPESAPKAVENFIGLATGTRDWTDPSTGQSTRRPLYNGTVFFRVIPGFMIQGGSPLDDPFGGPGYQFDDEFSPDHLFTKPGLIAMANSGPNANGSQFFITMIPAPWLNYKHAVFGEVVDGLAVARAISDLPRRPDAADRPSAPAALREVRIEYR